MYGLEEINERLMDGLEFCKKTYLLFEKIRVSPGGVQKLRLRKEKIEKKLIEEILPVARYVQMRYSQRRKIKVKWIDGGQQFDAYLLSSGPLVEERLIPRRQFLEVTTAVHKNDHLDRCHLNDKGYSFGPKGIKIDKKTKEIVSKPYVYTHPETENDFVKIITERVKEKSKKNYPENTSLIIQCMLDTLYWDSEWNYIVKQVKKAEIVHDFKEIFLFDSNLNYFATLYNSRKNAV